MLAFNEIRKGKVINYEGEPYQVTSASYMRKQQRRPVMRTTLKSLRTGATKEHSWQQSDKVEEADIARKQFQFLYREGDAFAFMDAETYEQVELNDEQVGDAAPWLLESQAVEILLFEGMPVSVELPIKIERKVIEAPPGVKGDTSSNTTKEITVEGGVRIKAPLFINEGDSIKIDSRTGEYVERA